MRRAHAILIAGRLLLLLLQWLANVSSAVSIPNDLSWLKNAVINDEDSDYDFHRPSVYARDASYLPEEFDDDIITDEEGARLSRNDRSLLPEYRNLCDTVTRKVELKNDPNYEYQPPHYHEIFCKSYSLMDDEPQKTIAPSKQKCAHPSFHCVQRSRTLFMVRRRWETECWEPMTKVVASGCDCMWPVSTLGDVSIHY